MHGKSVLELPKAYFCLLKIRNIFFVEIEIGLFLGSVCMLLNVARYCIDSYPESKWIVFKCLMLCLPFFE